MSTRSTAVPVGACLVALALTACGSTEPAKGGTSGAASTSPSTSAAAEPYADKSPQEIQQIAYEETRTASFKKVRGQLTAEGKTGSLSLSFDVPDCAGTFSIQGFGKREIHATPKVVYAKRDAEALRADLKGTKEQEDVVVERIADRWIKMSADLPDAQSVSYGCGLANPWVLLEEETPEMHKGASADVDGQPAITLTYAGSQGGTVTEYVATQGRPYLLKRTETGRQPSEITYYDFETVNQLLPPADSEVVLDEGL
ncbi:hypothetical protein ACFWBN_24630 [Streptomyces sp. NPDC059989]|uniref:hypothetical protein n=1 Tax=Streptomyces sp. NPDC059989 TaxID=3347026 RepID=UPI0036BF6037